ncbi:MAG TPA: hypothetical protein VIY30_18585 [Burkholderiaceae bacterium]
MIRHLAVGLAALLAGVAHAQQWVQLADPLAFDTRAPIWCNADRTACIISRQAYGAVGAGRVALTVAGTPGCKQRRLRYVYVRRSGESAGDLSTVHEMVGQTCIFDIPMTHIDGMRLLRFSVPMLTQDSVVMELSLEGFDVSRLSTAP